MADTARLPTETHRVTARVTAARVNRRALSAAMPYSYCLALGLAIAILHPSLLFGTGALDIRATAVLPLALVAFGQTLAIFTRGIDLSVGGILSTATALLATHFTGRGGALVGELLLVVAMGALGGAINGAIIGYTRLQPFIVTLATWSIWGGIALLILPQEGGQVSTQLTTWVTGSVIGIPKSVLAMAVLFLAWCWLRWSRLVLDLKAIGSDQRRAQLAGVRVARRMIQTYAISGTLAALAGIYLAGQAGGGSPIIGSDYILESVAAVVIGGASIFGGRGSAAGSMIGAIAFLMIPDLIFSANISSFWTGFVQGALLIAAVTLSSLLLQSRRSRL
jgi:ribose transport system permease protein